MGSKELVGAVHAVRGNVLSPVIHFLGVVALRWWLSGALCPLLLGACGSSDPNFDATLGEVRAELWVQVRVLGTREPVQPRRLVVELDPGFAVSNQREGICPILHLRVTVNGLPLGPGLGGTGQWTGHGCGAIWYERELEHELPSELTQSHLRIELSDDSGQAVVEGDNFITAPTASIVSPADGRLLPGQRVDFRISPESILLPRAIDTYYHADTPRLSFGMEFIEATTGGFAAQVVESAQPSTGHITIEGRGFGNAFQMAPSRCEGAQHCAIERSVCYDADPCLSGIFDGPGFDVLEIPASVVAASP